MNCIISWLLKEDMQRTTRRFACTRWINSAWRSTANTPFLPSSLISPRFPLVVFSTCRCRSKSMASNSSFVNNSGHCQGHMQCCKTSRICPCRSTESSTTKQQRCSSTMTSRRSDLTSSYERQSREEAPRDCQNESRCKCSGRRKPSKKRAKRKIQMSKCSINTRQPKPRKKVKKEEENRASRSVKKKITNKTVQ